MCAFSRRGLITQRDGERPASGSPCRIGAADICAGHACDGTQTGRIWRSPPVTRSREQWRAAFSRCPSTGLAGRQPGRGWFNHDDDLARGASLLDQLHSGCRVGEWVGAVDHRSDTAGFDEVADLGEGLGGDLGGE